MDQPVEPAEQPTCSICQGEFRDPKLLPCCHIFCAKCLEGLVTIKHQAEPTTYGGLSFVPSSLGLHSSGLRQARDEISIICPQCTTHHILSAQGGVHSLLTDYTVIQEQERQQWKDLLQRKDVCGMCEQDGGTIVSFCEDCESFLCSYCAGAHRRMKVFSGHHVSSLSSPEFQNIKPKLKPVTCQIHPECSVSFYCATCCQLICNECVATEGTEKIISSTIASDQVPKGVHQSHVLHMLTENHLTSLEDKLCQLLTSVGTRKEELQKDLVSIEDVEKESASHTEQLKKALVKQMERHIKQLQEQCEHDMKQVDENHAANLEDYRAKKSALKEKISKFSMKEEFASKAQSCNGRIPKIAMIAKAASELEALSRENFLSSSYEFGCALNKLHGPLVVRSLSKEIKSGLTQKIEGRDFTCSTSESTKSTPVSFTLGSKSQVIIKSSVQPVGTPQFKVIYGQSRRILKSTVQPAGAGSWLLECTPTCIATHKIEVCVFGHWISYNLPTVAVEGVLKEGDIVRRGPDPKSTAEKFLQKMGEDVKMAPQYETGKLTKAIHSHSLSKQSSKYELEITWGHESAKPLVERMPSSAWNETLGFPIELAL